MVTAHVDNENGGGSITEVQYYLARTYQKQYLEFPAIKHSPNTYLVELTPDIVQDEVIEAGNAWGFHTEWYFEQWDVNEDAGFEPKGFRVSLRIDKFPLDFWDQSFIHQAISEFGEVLHIEEQFIHGNDRSSRILDMACIDPKRIPFSSVLPYGKRWKKMLIQILGWKYIGWVPQEARFTTEEHRSLLMQTGRTTNYPRLSLLAAHDKLQRFFNTPHSPTPPPSPSYFSEDSIEADSINYSSTNCKLVHHTTEDQERHPHHHHLHQTTEDPHTKGGRQSHLIGLTEFDSLKGKKAEYWEPPRDKKIASVKTSMEEETWTPFVQPNQKGEFKVGRFSISMKEDRTMTFYVGSYLFEGSHDGTWTVETK